MKINRMQIGIIVCVVLFLLAVKWRKHVVIRKRNAPIVSFVKEWERMGKPVVVQQVQKTDVPTYTKVTSWMVSPNVFEGHVSKTVRDRLENGQEMIFKVDDYTFKGKIKKVSQEISFDTGMFSVFVEFEQEFDTPGWVVAYAHTGTIKNAINIDDEIAEYEEGKYYIWTVEDKKARRKEITVSSRNSYGLIVSKGVSEGELIVAEGQSKLNEGDKVNILAKKEGGPAK